MNALTQAIQSDQIDVILASCGLGAATSQDGIEALIKGLTDKYSEKK